MHQFDKSIYVVGCERCAHCRTCFISFSTENYHRGAV